MRCKVEQTLKDLYVTLQVDARLLDFMPPHRRSASELDGHLRSHGLTPLVDWNRQREVDAKSAELGKALLEAITADPPSPAAEVLAMVKAKQVMIALVYKAP